MKKCLFVFLFLASTAFVAFSQPTITVQREGDDGDYSTSQNIYGETINVLAGETIKLKIVISEISPGDFLNTISYENSYGSLTLSTQTYTLLKKPMNFIYSYGFIDGSDSSDIVSFSGASYGNPANGDGDLTSVEQGVKLDGVLNSDTIVIEDVKLIMPTTLYDGETFSLKLESDFISDVIDNPATLVTFEYKKPQLTVVPQEKACEGKKVRCNLSVTPAGLEYVLDTSGITTNLTVTGSTTVDLYNGTEVKVFDPNNEHSEDTASNTEVIDDEFFLPMDNYKLEQSIKLPKNEGRVNMFNRFSGATFVYDSLYADSELSNKVYGDSENYKFAVKNRKDGETNDYTFGRFHFEYNDADYHQDDSIFNTKANGITYGPGDKNLVTFHYGKYFNTQQGKVCIDSVQTDIEIVQNKVFISKNSFCSTDETAYYFEIDTTVSFSSIDSGYIYNRRFKKYILRKPVSGHEYDMGTSPKGSITPSLLWEREGGGSSLPVEIAAITEVDIIPKPPLCPDQWSDEYTGHIYHTDDKVSYSGSIYRAKENLEVNQDDPPDQASYWEKLHSCVIYNEGERVSYQASIYRAVVDITTKMDQPPNDAGYWEKLHSCFMYTQGQRVSYLGDIYEATRNITYSMDQRPDQASYWEYVIQCPENPDGPDLPDGPEQLSEQKSQKAQQIDYCLEMAWRTPPRPEECIEQPWNPGQVPTNCREPGWNPNRTPEPIYENGDSVTNNGIIYKCLEDAYVNDLPGSSDKWLEIKPCENTGDIDTSTITYEYASKIINIYKPKSDFTLNLKKKHCITNREINLTSNYQIDAIENHRGSIEKERNEWIFTPEQMVEEGEDKNTANLKLTYTDDNGCQNSFTHEIEVAESNGLHPPFSFNSEFDTAYCEIDKDYNLSSSFTIEKLSGPGIRHEYNSYLFNPDSALHDNSSDIEVEFILDYRDEQGCKYDSSFNVQVFDSPVISFDYENLCIGDFTKYSDTIDFLGDMDSVTRTWSFGDYKKLKYKGTGIIQEGTHDGSTRGTYDAPEHKYEKPGKYSVSLQVKSQKGCSDQVTDTVVIGEHPVVDFSADGYITGRRTAFNNNTTAAAFDPVVSYTWNFDDDKAFSDIEKTSKRNVFYAFQTPGVHDVRLTAVTHNGCQSGKTVKVPVFPLITLDDSNVYQERFDDSSNGWLSSGSYDAGENCGWSLVPTEGAYKQEGHQGQMWLTASPANDMGDEASWVESPVFNIDSLNFPLLSVDIYQSVEEGRDGAVVQYTVDDGENWHLLGRTGEGLGWYDKTGIVSNPGSQEGTGNIGWSSNSRQWQTARFPIDTVRQASRSSHYPGVRFRMSYSSDNGNAEGLDLNGFGFDNFMISQRSRIVLLEQFVNSVWDKKTQEQEEAWLDEFVESRKQEVVDMRYHTKIGHQADPLYYLNWQDINARAFVYGAFSQELTVVDGIHRCLVPAEEEAAHYYRKRALIDKRFDIDVSLENDGDSLYVTATVKKLVDSLPVKISQRSCVRMAIIQKKLEYEGEVYKNVMVELLPTNVGNLAGIVPGDLDVNEPFTVRQSWGPDLTTIGNDFRLVVYVQNMDGKENIHQVWFTDLDKEVVPQVEVDDPFKYDYLLNTRDEEHLAGVQFYPMPVNSKLHIEWEKPVESEMRWELMSVNGQVLRQGKIIRGALRKTIDLANFAEGSYVLVLFNKEDQRIIRRKIIISR